MSFSPYPDHVNRGVSHAVEVEKVVDLAVEESADVDTTEAKSCSHEIDVLGDVAGFEKDKAVTAIAIFKDRPFEDGRDENYQRGVEGKFRLVNSLRDCLCEISLFEQPEVVPRRIVVIETGGLPIHLRGVEKNLKRIKRASGGHNSKRSGQARPVIRSAHSIRQMEECSNLVES